MIISFALTKSEIIAGLKSQTRRAWKPRKTDQCRKNSKIDCWSQLPYVSGAHCFATAKATNDAFYQHLGDISADDVIAEGFPKWSPSDFIDFFKTSHPGVTEDTKLAVINFEITQIDDLCLRQTNELILTRQFYNVQEHTSVFALYHVYKLIPLDIFNMLIKNNAKTLRQAMRLNHFHMALSQYDALIQLSSDLRRQGVSI